MRRRLWVVSAIAGLLSACALFTDLSGFEGTQPPDAMSEGDATLAGDAGNSDAGTSDVDAPEDAGLDVVDAGGPDACVGADISSDPLHCGACNHSCLGGACTFGKCGAVPIISGLNTMVGFVIADGKIYVGVAGGIRRYELDGTQGVDVASSPDPGYLAADAKYLYFTDRTNDLVKRWPLAGGLVEDLTSATGGAFGIALSPTHVYFTRYVTDGGIERFPIDGGPRENVIERYNRPEDIDFVDGELLVGGDGVDELALFADAGFGAKRTLSSGGGPCGVTAYGGMAYFGEQGTGKIFRVPLSGGNKVELSSLARVPVGIHVTDTALYWRNYDGGTVMRLAH